MNDLIEIQYQGIFEIGSTEVEFMADYEGYQITGTINCRTVKEDKEEDVGIMDDSYIFNGATFWGVEVQNELSEKITLNEEELNACKNDIENYFNGLIQQF